MRVLAIRGKNLASLPRFDVDLDGGPLAHTRIFAITGPTGAGKSTLLDALCLALYDRAPRLDGARDVLAGELEVGATDPRSLMRRGSIDAHAEVDFRGHDGLRYRATWEVRRAHRRLDGRLQPQKMRLFALDAGRDLTGATKTETLGAIESRVGLSFTEFRRAVLLAQGEFASFLEAKPDQRAELLEKMTGTELYAELSRAAFVRTKQEEERLLALEGERARLAGLSAEERSALEAEHTRTRIERGAVTTALEAARRLTEWHDTHAKLAAERASAEAEVAGARRDLADAEPLRRLLRLASEAEQLRPLYDAWRAAEREQRGAETAHVEGQRALEEVRLEQHARETAVDRAAAAHAEAEGRAEALRPDLERARALDHRIRDAANVHAAAARTAAEATARATSADDAVESSSRARDEVTAKLTLLVDALTREADVARLAAQWPRWKGELLRFGAAEEERRPLADEGTDLARRLEHATRTLDAARTELATAEHDARSAQAAADEARAELDAQRKPHAPADLRAAVERVTRELESLATMKASVADARRITRTAADESKRAKHERKAAQELKRALPELREKVRALEAELEECVAQKEQAEGARELAARRPELLATGEPCPLCGSTEHPWADVETPRSTRARSLKRKHDRLAKALEDAKAEVLDGEQRQVEHARAHERAAARVQELGPEVERRAADWAKRRDSLVMTWVDSGILAARGVNRVGLLIPESFESKSAGQDVERAMGELAGHRVALRELLALDELRAESLERSRATAERAARQVDEARAERERAATEERALAERTADVERKRSAVAARADEALGLLAQPFGARDDWKKALVASPRATAAELEALVAAHEARRARREATAEALGRAERELDDARRAAARAGEERARMCAIADEAERALEALRAERASLLGGRAITEVAEALERATRTGARELEEARQSAVAADRRRTQLEERAAQAKERHTRAVTSRDGAAAKLDAALDATAFTDVDALGALLARERSALDEDRARLAALDEGLVRNEALLADRTARLTSHEASAPASGTPEGARASRAALEVEQQRLVDAEARLLHALGSDDAVKAELAALAPRIDAQRRTFDRWSELNALIGSADGKKLRTFAQGLTLDALLDHANAHLGELRPRYRLERVRGHDMELAVLDGDMGDELRAIATLSGGETFLVSLALALGLSSLSAKETAIQSLFIDEGFGSLDPESLEIALGTLDRLQAAGRTIGLISHVPELAARIGFQVQVRPAGPGRSEVTVVES